MRNGTHMTGAALFAAAVVATAGAAVPAVGISISSSGGGSASGTPAGTAVSGAPNQYSYVSQLFSPGKFFSSYSLNAIDTSVSDRMVFGGLVTVINSGASAQDFAIDLTASTTPRGPASLVGGSMSGTLAADADGASFSTGGTMTGWTGLIGSGGSSTTAGSMFGSPLAVTAAPFLTAQIPGQSFGMPIPSLPSVGMGNSVTIQLRFTLGAGDRLDLTTVYVVQASSGIPAPGAACLLAVAGLAGRRRRR